jgi:hypothetical protein
VLLPEIIRIFRLDKKTGMALRPRRIDEFNHNIASYGIARILSRSMYPLRSGTD